MTQLISRRFRVALDIAKQNELTDQTTGQAPKHWAGNPAAFQLGLFSAGAIVSDVSNIESIELQLKANAGSGSTKTVPADDAATVATASIVTADLAAVTSDDWTNKDGQHGTIELTGAQLAQEPGHYWLVFAATLTGISAPVVLGAGWIEIVQDGYGDPGTPPVGETYLTAAQSDARYMNRTPAAQPASETASGTALDWHWDGTKLSLCVGDDEWIELVNVVTKFTNP